MKECAKYTIRRTREPNRGRPPVAVSTENERTDNREEEMPGKKHRAHGPGGRTRKTARKTFTGAPPVAESGEAGALAAATATATTPAQAARATAPKAKTGAPGTPDIPVAEIVGTDLRKVAILSASLIIILIAAWLVIHYAVTIN